VPRWGNELLLITDGERASWPVLGHGIPVRYTPRRLNCVIERQMLAAGTSRVRPLTILVRGATCEREGSIDERSCSARPYLF
jgi:hypothetical protein